MSTIRSRDRRLYNKDLAPTDKKKKNWGWFEIFNVWIKWLGCICGDYSRRIFYNVVSEPFRSTKC